MGPRDSDERERQQLREEVERLRAQVAAATQAEDAFRRNQAILDSIHRAAPIGIGLVKNRILGWTNRRMAEMTGYTAAELEGQSARIIYPSDEEFERVAQVKHPQIDRMGVGHVECVFRRKDGQLIDVLLSSAAIVPGCPAEGLVFTALDISDLKRVREELAAVEDRFQLLVKNSNDVIVVLDADGTARFISQSVERLTGFPAEHLVHRSARELVHPDDQPALDDAFARLREKPAGIRRTEYRQSHRDGGWVWVEAIGTNLLHDPRISGIVLNLRDVTERKLAEQESERLQAQLLQSQKMESIGRLAGGVAHDFNNLLTGINGNLSLAIMDLGTEHALAGALGEALTAAERAAALTQQLLAFSRKQLLAPRAVDLNALIENLRRMLARIIGEDIELETVLEPGLGPIHADPGQIEQVVVNLAVNARDAMPGGGKLTIRTSSATLDEAYCSVHSEARPGPRIRLAITDSGVGMPPEVRAHIFEPFFTTKKDGQGTGLGLATVYGIIRQHQGAIEVHSAAGEGTTVEVYLQPAAGPVERTAAEPRSLDDRLATGTETILLVEDDALVRSTTRSILRRLGYTVFDAASAIEAEQLAAEHKIDLLFTDVVMPGVNGRVLADRLRARDPGLRVLFASGYTEDAIAQHGVLERGIQFIGKPFSPHAVARKIREVLEGAR